MALFDAEELVDVAQLEPVRLEVVRGCHFKAKPCATCGAPKSSKVHGKDGACATFRAQRGCERCGGAKKARVHLGQPPSMNVWGRSGDGFTYMNVKGQWQEAFLELLRATGLPKGLRRVFAEGEATFPDRARRDQGNFRVLIEKALGDALQGGGWLEDDDWSSYEFGNLTQVHTPGESATRVVLFPTMGRS